MNSSVPTHIFLERTNLYSWFNSEIEQLDLAYSRWKRFKTPQLHDVNKTTERER